MSLKLNFSKVTVISFSRKIDGGSAKISCSPSKTVAKAMGWGDFPDWQKGGQPQGELAASIVEFIPSHSDLSKHAIELTTLAVRDFEFIRKQVKNGKTSKKSPSFRTELHCVVDFSDENGAKKLEGYMQAVPDSTMRVTYEKAAEQEEIPLTEAQQATLEENN